MTRAPAALATAVLLSGLRTVSAEPCPPRAELDGDAAAVVRVEEELRRLGVALAPGAAGCPRMRAVVELDAGGGIAVAVHGAVRGSEGRVVSDAALAAAWIDSWLRDGVDAGLWAPPLPPRVTAIVHAPLVPPRGVEPAVNTTKAGLFERIAVAGHYEQDWADDGSSWRGAGGSACVMFGRFCLGARVRGVFEAARAVGSTAMSRSDLSVLATARIPLEVGRMTIAPELGVGIGRINTRRLDGCEPQPLPPPNCDPMDPACAPLPADGMCEPDPNTMPGTNPNGTIYVGDDLDVSTVGPRVAVALRVAVPLFQHVWLEGLASLGVAPFHHGESFEAEPQMQPVPPEELALPGEPRATLQLGVGLRIGAP